MGNVTYIAAIDEYGTVTNCLWPALTDEVNAVVQLVVDWGAGTAEADPDFDQNQCGRQVENFADAALVDRAECQRTKRRDMGDGNKASHLCVG